MGFALRTNFRGSLRTLLWVCLATLALVSAASNEVRAIDSLGLDMAADETLTALDEMADALNATPRDVQTAISADLHLMSQAAVRAVDRLEDGTVPIADPSLVYDLNFLTDVATTTTLELRAAAAKDGDTLAPDRAERIDALTDAAAARLIEVNLVIDGWAERSRNAVVELAEVDGAVVVRSTDRLIYNGIRYISIGLLLVGLLVVGLQLLRMSEDRVDSVSLLRETPVLSSLAFIALAVFFAGCFVFSLRPGTLAMLSAEVRQQPQEHPCERLAEQRDRLIAAQQAEHADLVDATKERMAPAARDCLGLPSESATAAAIDNLAAKTVVAYQEPLRPSPVDVAVAEAEPEEEEVSDTDGIALPEIPMPPDAEEAADLDALADLAAQLRNAEDALSDRLDDSVDEHLGKPEDAPTTTIRPAAAPPARPPQAEAATAAVEPEPGESLPEPAPPAPRSPPAAANGTARSKAANGPDEADLYVTTTAVNYRAGPSLAARRLGTFVPGARLAVIDEDDGWSEVRLGDGREVFVATEFLEAAP